LKYHKLSSHFLFSAVAFLLVGFLLWPPDHPVHADDGVWSTFGDTNDVHALAFEGDSVLWAATFGGVVRWDMGVNPPAYTVFSMEHGLPSNMVLSVAVDQAGVKWFGTDRGLARYAGSTWQIFTPANTGNQLRLNQIELLAVDSAGQIWASNSGGGGTSVLVNGTWQGYNSIEEAISAHYGILRSSHSSLIWSIEPPDKIWTTIGNQPGARMFDGAWHFYPLQYVDATVVDNQHVKWFGTDEGVKSFDGTNWQTYTSDNTGGGLVPGVVKTAVIDGDGTKWFGARACGFTGCTAGVSSLAGSTWTPYTGFDSANQDIRAMAVDAQNRKWIATDHGILRLSGNQWVPYRTQTLPGNNVTAATVDSAGRVWVGTDTAGIGVFDGTTWTTYNRATGSLPSDAVHALASGPNNTIWAATGDELGGTIHGGISTWLNGGWIQQTQLPTAYFQALAVEPDGVVWAGTANPGKIWRYNGLSWAEVLPDSGLAVFSSVNGIALDSFGNKWFATNGGLLMVNDIYQWSAFTTNNTAGGLLSNNIFSVATDRLDRVWIGTDQGLNIYDPFYYPHWSNYTSPSRLPGNNVRSISVDRAGRAWIGTGDLDPYSTQGGVTVYDGTRWSTFTTADGLSVNNVQVIALSPMGEAWFGTWGGGLSRKRTGCPADFVIDGIVNAADLQAIVADWHTTRLRYDLNGDGRITIADVERAGSLWGLPCP